MKSSSVLIKPFFTRNSRANLATNTSKLPHLRFEEEFVSTAPYMGKLHKHTELKSYLITLTLLTSTHVFSPNCILLEL